MKNYVALGGTPAVPGYFRSSSSCAVAHPVTHENAPADSLEEATVDSPGREELFIICEMLNFMPVNY